MARTPLRTGLCILALAVVSCLLDGSRRALVFLGSEDVVEQMAISRGDDSSSEPEARLMNSRERLAVSSTSCGHDCPPADVTLPADYESLFYNADVMSFMKEAVCGSPFNYLPQYDNPCWMAVNTTTNSTTSVSTSPRSDRVDEAVCQVRCLPLIHLAGFAKCGTSDLYRSLGKHPYIVHTRKEPVFWSLGRFGRNYTFERYIYQFQHKVDEIVNFTEVIDGRERHPKLLMDASSTKVYYMDGWRSVRGHGHLEEPKFTTAMSIRALTPQAKIILIMRNPTDRTYSRYTMLCRSCSTSEFHEIVSGFISEMRDCLRNRTIRSCAYDYTYFTTRMPFGAEKHSMFIRASIYYVYVKDWLDVFPPDQVFVVHAETFFADRISVVRDVLRFIGLDPSLIDDETWQSIGSKPPTNVSVLKGRLADGMLNKTRKLLDDFFRPYNRMLADLLGDKRFQWD